MNEIEYVVTVLDTVASWAVWVIGLATLVLMASLPLLESLAQRREAR